jgi:competence protein ComFC
MIPALLDLFFPKRCIGCKKFGTLLCDICFAKISYDTPLFCPECNRRSIDGATHPKCKNRYSLDGVSSGVAYQGIVRKLVYQFKYAPYLSSLEEIMVTLLYESIIQNEVAYKKLEHCGLLIPVPLHARKQKKRGYNHAALLAKGLGKRLGLPMDEKLLVRVRETKPQFSLKREERYENIKGAFQIDKSRKNDVKGKDIILIDDLATSCATLNECANILKRAGAESVWAITFARE